MTQEERELLLKDLCARLPYQPVCEYTDTEDDFCTATGTLGYSLCNFIAGKILIKPYLRPMLSMTEKEFQELRSICPHSVFNKTSVSGWIVGINGSDYGRISRVDEINKLIDWLNKKMFDYRGLIEKGLALQAPEGMYDIK